MRRAAIMQPTYLPWLGYFALIDIVDVFVFLDDVQFDRRSWQQRNRIKGPNGEILLTVPVHKAPRDAVIEDIEINFEQDFPDNHIANLEHNYRPAPYFDDYVGEIIGILRNPMRRLADLNITLIKKLIELLGLDADFLRSAGARSDGTKDVYLARICQEVSADRYLSPPGARTYLEGSDAFRSRDISIQFLDFDHPTYPQLYGSFLSHLSVVDLLFNVGPEAPGVLRSGYQTEG